MRTCVDRAGGERRGNLPAVDKDNRTAEPRNVREVLRCEHERTTGPNDEPPDDVAQCGSAFSIDIGEWFVEKQSLRFKHQSAG